MNKDCDICGDKAVYDGKTTMGPWAYMCEDCFGRVGVTTPGLSTKLEDIR